MAVLDRWRHRLTTELGLQAASRDVSAAIVDHDQEGRSEPGQRTNRSAPPGGPDGAVVLASARSVRRPAHTIQTSSILVFTPDRARRAGIAHRSRLVHGAQR